MSCGWYTIIFSAIKIFSNLYIVIFFDRFEQILKVKKTLIPKVTTNKHVKKLYKMIKLFFKFFYI